MKADKIIRNAKTITAFVPLLEVMNIEEMLLGFTINGAKQLGIEAFKGSIEAGKDAKGISIFQGLSH